MHGDLDDLIPAQQGKDLATNLSADYKVLEGQTHNRIDNTIVIANMREFLVKYNLFHEDKSQCDKQPIEEKFFRSVKMKTSCYCCQSKDPDQDTKEKIETTNYDIEHTDKYKETVV